MITNINLEVLYHLCLEAFYLKHQNEGKKKGGITEVKPEEGKLGITEVEPLLRGTTGITEA